MGANIYYKQVRPADRRDLDVDTPSSFIQSMRDAFGEPPWRLTREHITLLSGMGIVSRQEPNPYKQLINAIHQLEEIDVWAEW